MFSTKASVEVVIKAKPECFYPEGKDIMLRWRAPVL